MCINICLDVDDQIGGQVKWWKVEWDKEQYAVQ